MSKRKPVSISNQQSLINKQLNLRSNFSSIKQLKAENQPHNFQSNNSIFRSDYSNSQIINLSPDTLRSQATSRAVSNKVVMHVNKHIPFYQQHLKLSKNEILMMEEDYDLNSNISDSLIEFDRQIIDLYNNRSRKYLQ
jgi:hypothetical protein